MNLPPWSLSLSSRYCGVKEGMGVGNWELGNALMVCEGMAARFMLQVEGASVRKGVGSPGESVAWSLGFSKGWERWDLERIYQGLLV